MLPVYSPSLVVVLGPAHGRMSAFPRLFGVGLMRALFASFRGADGAAAGPVEALGDVFLVV